MDSDIKLTPFHGCCCEWLAIHNPVRTYQILNGKTSLSARLFT